MIFGRSLFGGATSGQILVTGFAAVLATAAAVPEVIRPVTAQAAVTATAVAPATKLLTPQTSTSTSGEATATAAARVDFYGYGQAQAVTALHALPSVEFFLAGGAQARLTLDGLASKRTRMQTALGWASAAAEADGQVYEYANPAPARCTAQGLGTTYFVGRADARPAATAEGRCSLVAGGIGPGQIAATATGECRRAGGAAAHAQTATATSVDAAVTRAGVRMFELVGEGVGAASATVAHTVVYQIQSVRAGATAVAGNNLHTKGAKGRGVIGAAARGIAVGTQTAVTGAGGSRTTASGWAEHRVSRGGSGVGRSGATAKGASFFNGRASAATQARAFSTDVHLLVKGQLAAGAAEGLAMATRTQHPRGDAVAQAAAPASIQVNDIIKASTDRTVGVDGEYRHVQVPDQPRVIYV